MFQLKQRQRYTPPVRPASKRRLDPWYVTGFVEGEGCFTYSRSGTRLAMYFAVKLSRADRRLLVALQGFFGGVGVIYDLSKTASYYRVCRRVDLDSIVAHFDAYPPRGRKGSSYRIWREMCLLKRRSAHPSRERLNALAARLSAASLRNRSAPASGAPGPPVESDHLSERPGDAHHLLEPKG